MNLVSEIYEIIANVRHFDNYRQYGPDDDLVHYRELMRLGKNFVCLTYDGRYLFCPSRFSGYVANTIQAHLASSDKHGGSTTKAISKVLGHSPFEHQEAEIAFRDLCQILDVTPRNVTRAFWMVEAESSQKSTNVDDGFSTEAEERDGLLEGATKKVLVNAYERDRKARKECIDFHGNVCAVCSFDFEATYGEIGKGFIHVHHLKPLSHIGKEYRVDPIKDLIPVCPNCHAMLHKAKRPYSIEEMRRFIGSAAKHRRLTPPIS